MNHLNLDISLRSLLELQQTNGPRRKYRDSMASK